MAATGGTRDLRHVGNWTPQLGDASPGPAGNTAQELRTRDGLAAGGKLAATG